jgi:N-acetylglucosaminyldiphosphoundecaprenol N-acetyl-beta-D-mannosaminyltransferase
MDFQQALEACLERAASGLPGYACFANVHMLAEARDQPDVAEAVNAADWAFPDGLPLAKALSRVYQIPVERVAGMDFIHPFLDGCSARSLRVCVYGGSEAMQERARTELPRRYPGVRDWLFICPPFGQRSPADVAGDIGRMADFGPGATLVILGCPRQERFMATHRHRIPGLMLGLGGALPTLLGFNRRAPEWARQMMMEWAWRLFQEPGRLWKRYALTNTRFLFWLAVLFIFRPKTWLSSS